jgi:hypothetical protein
MDAFADAVFALGMDLDAIHAVHYDATEKAFHPMYASLPIAKFNAWWDFQVLYEDRSKSAHNPTYAKELLAGAKAAL